MKKSFCLLLAVLAAVASAFAQDAASLSLAGQWKFALDPDGTLTAASSFTDEVTLPGTTDTNQKGQPLSYFEETTHLSRRFYYKGRAWYSREVVVPKSWKLQPIALFLERTKNTEVYVDGQSIGHSNDISTPQVYALPRLKPGRHVLTIMVDNSSGVPEQLYASSHAYTEDTQTNWNGIIGRIELLAAPAATLCPSHSTTSQVGGESIAAKRTLTASDHHFYLDGKLTFLRGRHDACVWPLTAHVPMDIDSWRQYMQTCTDYGLNHVRFHSWCPPEAAFQAADEAGIILQPELPFWGDFNASDTVLMTFLHKEGESILRWYGHHPSFRMFALGNELWGNVEKMQEFVEDFRRMAPDKLYTFGSNYHLGYQGVKPGMDYFTTCRVGGEGWGNYNTHTRGSFSFADAADGGMINHFRPSLSMNFAEGCALSTVPVISHETAQFQTYPDYSEIKKYTGVLRPCNLEVFRQRLEKAGMADQAEAFHRASGLWAMQLYKQDIEMDLRTPNMAGFQLLDLQDYPGQGSAYVGVLDAFLDTKGLITPLEWRGFCAPVVPLLVADKFCFTDDEPLTVGLQVANYSGQSLCGRTLRCHLISHDGDTTTTRERSIAINTDAEGLIDLGTVTLDYPHTGTAQRLTVSLEISGQETHNDYPLWIYPKEQPLNKQDITIASELTDDIMQRLEQGASVLFMPERLRAADSTDLCVGGLFQTDYWNYRMFKTISENNKRDVSPGTLGILCDPKHPLLRDFPTEDHTSWQWFPVIKASHPFILDNTGRDYRPIVQVIDNIERNHKLGLVFEFRVGRGRLLVVMSQLDEAAAYPEGRQFYASVLNYMHSTDFAPQTSVTPDQLRALFTTPVGETKLEELNNISPY